MDVCSPFIANLPSPISVQPRMGSLDDPPRAPQFFRAFDPPPCDARLNPPLPQGLSLLRCILGLIGLEFLGPLAGPASGAPDRFHRIDRGFHHLAVMDMGCREGDGQRDAVLVDHPMALRARFSAIRRIRPGRFAPPGAGPVAESNEARDPSIRSASPSRSRNTLWRRFQTPASCHDRSLRQQVMPLPQPISWGHSSQGMPVISTNKIPVSTCGPGWGVFPLSA